ncbi:MAG: hypothetical protein JO076_12415 [Verrucomicrobia bacterium]|nr:hypothetical protein [Verrucomicrobiota bacterium]
MKTDLQTCKMVIPQTVSLALSRLKERLQQNYERVYPGIPAFVQRVLDEEEINAWKLSDFPHLLLPDLVEVRLDRLNLHQVKTKEFETLMPPRVYPVSSLQPTSAFSLQCTQV